MMTFKTNQNTLKSYASTLGMSCKAPFNMCILSACSPGSTNGFSPVTIHLFVFGHIDKVTKNKEP